MTGDLQPLRDWLAAYPEPDPAQTEYQPGSSTVAADGTRVLRLGWYRYGPAFDALWSALEASGWSDAETARYVVVVREWEAGHGPGGLSPAYVPIMDRFTLRNALRFYQRGERFCDGLWLTAWKKGFFHAAARALLLFDQGEAITPAAAHQGRATAPPARTARR